MKLRKLKIHDKYRQREYDRIIVPYIKLEGIWLEKLGFEIGGEVLVKQQKNKLTITIDKKG